VDQVEAGVKVISVALDAVTTATPGLRSLLVTELHINPQTSGFSEGSPTFRRRCSSISTDSSAKTVGRSIGQLARQLHLRPRSSSWS
jgi:hypothetical protein